MYNNLKNNDSVIDIAHYHALQDNRIHDLLQTYGVGRVHFIVGPDMIQLPIESVESKANLLLLLEDSGKTHIQTGRGYIEEYVQDSDRNWGLKLNQKGVNYFKENILGLTPSSEVLLKDAKANIPAFIEYALDTGHIKNGVRLLENVRPGVTLSDTLLPTQVVAENYSTKMLDTNTMEGSPAFDPDRPGDAAYRGIQDQIVSNSNPLPKVSMDTYEIVQYRQRQKNHSGLSLEQLTEDWDE
jgi:hypothetical protein